MSSNPRQRPFLKWAGNKYRCLEHILPRLGKGKRLLEPFAGSGAIFLNSRYPQYLLNDQNPELIHLYQYLKNEGEDFIKDCKQWFCETNNQKERYYELRQIFNEAHDTRERAILFLYLNRHGYNGLCRFNKQGKFNVPFGSYLKPYFPLEEMRYFHQKSQYCDFSHQDFTEVFKHAEKGDVIYCDPPYHPLTPTSSFTAYTKQEFLEKEQQHLADLAIMTAERGVNVFISNHDTAFTRKLYQAAHKIYSFKVARTISSKGNKRQAVSEILTMFRAR